MTRTIPASIQAGFAGHRQPLSRCVKLSLRDGTTLAFSDHDEDLLIDIDDGDGVVTYRPDQGILSRDIELVLGLEASTTEIVVPFVGGMTRNAALGRRYNQAVVWIFDVDFTQDSPEPLALLKGRITEVFVHQNAAVFEIRGLSDFFNITQGRILSPRCSADFGDADCGQTPEEVATTVIEKMSDMRFRVAVSGTYADGYFKYGQAQFTSGELANINPSEVFDYTGQTGLVMMHSPLPDIPQVGDNLTLKRGCSNLKSTSDPNIPTCLSYNNVRRFRGFDRVPGSDIYLRVAVPGEGATTTRGRFSTASGGGYGFSTT